MKTLYLASEIDITAKSIAEDIGNVSKLKTVFINTAAEAKEGHEVWLPMNRQGLVDAGFDLTDYTITGKTPKQIAEDLEKFDIIHVNGGDTFHLLQQAAKSGFDKWIKTAVGKGKIYMGSSAGSIAASMDVPGYYKKGTKGKLGLGLIDVQVVSHWGREDKKKDYLNTRMQLLFEEERKLILLRDTQYLRCIGDCFQVISTLV